MYDVIHAAIARERVRELVETADGRRATRRPRTQHGSEDARAAMPSAGQAPAAVASGRMAARLRLRLRLRPRLH
jgi:hypothetical protein